MNTEDEPPQAVIELCAVTVANPRSPETALLESVDWRVMPGEFWVVTGMQGSGKTALLETAAGLHPFQSGTLKLFGHTVTGMEGDEFKHQRRRLGVVFEGSGRLFHPLTVAENVALPLRYHRDGTLEDVSEEVIPLLELMGLQGMANVPSGRLSRAWAQRVALARALVLKPEVLFLDNPLAGMDVQHVRWWRQFIHQLSLGHPQFHAKPMTLVAACDDPRPWLELGHQFVLAHERHWRLLGTQADVLANREALVRDITDVIF
jgi:ABC-type transporter Mla maintaining outer membrane lipid asymmetry ATPase subunit MlaF